jgi:hypothetical protein
MWTQANKMNIRRGEKKVTFDTIWILLAKTDVRSNLEFIYKCARLFMIRCVIFFLNEI